MPILETTGDQKYHLSLPTVSFRIIADDKALTEPAGVHSEQLRHYGYNDFQDWDRGEFYHRYIEPIDEELKKQVEYDMDEQDQAWLDQINDERKKEQSGPISYEAFEILMDKLEKEWFDLVKQIPQPASHLPVEDSKCAICDDGEGENSNAIVFCDGCNLAVHQDCYGVPYIPEGQWLCRKCTVSPENPVSCVLCPSEGGAFKQTSTGHWAHLLCAMWIPELSVGNAIYMEPIEGMDTVPKNRWKLVCSLCRERVGACIQCENRNCFIAFHVTCARQLGLLMSMKSLSTDGILRAYCEKHAPAGSRTDGDDEVASSYSESAPPTGGRRQGSHSLKAPVTTKSARAHAKSYRPGPPLVPKKIVKNLIEHVQKMSIRKREPFIERICRYWSLKREARRGAPLLKRLHLEPWTASNASRQQTEMDKARKLKFLTMLRTDLDKVRMLAELVRKREREKLRQAQLIKDVIDSCIFSYYGKLRLTLEKISAMDRQELFLHPVNRTDVPDYFVVVKEPMCWLQIDDRIERNTYRDVVDFKHDIELTLDNAMLYNKADNPFHRTAKRIKSNAQPLLDELISISAPSTRLEADGDRTRSGSLAGSLEPAMEVLHALIKSTTDDPTQDLLASLFAFAVERPRPVTPPPPSPPAKKPRKGWTHAERQQKWEEGKAEAQIRLSTGRPTRASRAIVNAFVEEAGSAGSSTAHAPAEPALQRSGRRSIRGGLASPITPLDGTVRPRSQVGVVGLETIAKVSDRERREMERQMDIAVSEVDKKEQLLRFNVGWVLPEGSKRRRLERAEIRSMVTVQPKSSQSTATPASPVKRISARWNIESSLTPAPEDEIVVSPDINSEAEKTGQSPTPLFSRRHTDRGRKRKAAEATATEEGIRANKKAKQDRPAEEVVALFTPISTSRASRKGKGKANDDEDLLTPASMDQAVQPAEPLEEENGKESPAFEDDTFSAGTLVWAKIQSFPYWPAEVIDPEEDSQSIPPAVLRIRPSKTDTEQHGRSWLVRFYDATGSFAWLRTEKLDMLGDSNEIDQLYLHGKERKGGRGFKTPHLRTACRKAYREAMAEMEVDEPEPVV